MNNKFSVFTLLAVILMSSACSAKDANTVSAASTASSDVATSSNQDPAPSIDEQFAAVFAKTEQAVKDSLVNNPKNYQAGVHFDVYDSPQGRVSAVADKIEVVEFFSYGCGACFGAEPTIHALEKNLGEDVNLVRVPAVFNQYFEHLARAYYAANSLGVSESAHNAIFKEIHINKKSLQTAAQIGEFYSNYGVDKDQFMKAYKSFSVNASINRSRELAKKYQVAGVPNIVVNGKYLTTGTKAGSYEAWAQILGQLVDMERKAQ